MLTVEIPVPTHLKKFLEKKHSSDFVVIRNTFLGMIILDSMVGKRQCLYDYKENDYPDVLEFQLHENYYNKGLVEINPEKKQWLVRLFEKLFNEDLFFYVNKNLNEKTFAKKLIEEWLAYYKIGEDDIKLESLYKRYKRRVKDNIKSKKNNL